LIFEDIEEAGEKAFLLGDVHVNLLFVSPSGDFVADIAEADVLCGILLFSHRGFLLNKC